jgi:hypothetical protein
MTTVGLVVVLVGLAAAIAGEVAAVRHHVVVRRRVRLSDLVVLAAFALLVPRFIEVLT